MEQQHNMMHLNFHCSIVSNDYYHHMILHYQQGLYTIFETAWGLDFTNEVAKRYDAASADKPAAAKTPAPASAPAKKK